MLTVRNIEIQSLPGQSDWACRRRTDSQRSSVALGTGQWAQEIVPPQYRADHNRRLSAKKYIDAQMVSLFISQWEYTI